MGDLYDFYEDALPFFSGAQSSVSMPGQGATNTQQFVNPFGTFMNNPYRMNMQKCMDSDMCKAWVTSNIYQGLGSSTGTAQSNTGAASTGSGSDASSDATSGSSDASSGTSGAASGGAVSGRTGYSPELVGFPPGFHPAVYGLDYDALPVDCMDDSKCARGLMMYTQGRNVGGSLSNLFQQFMYGQGSRLQRPRRLSRPRYGVPYRYGRQY